MLDIPYFLYMKHEQEKEDIINELIDIAITTEDYFSEEEWEEIREEVERRL